MNEYHRKIIIRPVLLNLDLFRFIYILLKYIFLKKNQSYQNALNNKLDSWIEKINKYLIKSKDKYINKQYTLKNLQNIIFFVKNQNSKYCGDIIENILIFIFSKVFDASKENALYKYIHNNLNKMREQKNQELLHWINKEKIASYEFDNIENLLDIDGKEDEFSMFDEKEKCIFYNFLRSVLIEKYNFLVGVKDYNNKKNMLYINNGNYFNFLISLLIYKKIRKEYSDSLTILDKDINKNSMMNIESNLTFPLSEKNKPIVQLILAFFSQVYIYHINKISPLLPYSIPDKNLALIPFDYDLRGACIEGRFSYVVIAPLRIGDFTSNIYLKQNNLRESGLFELGKLCVFNKKLKLIECDTGLVRSPYLDFLISGMGIFYNDSVEEINLSYNYLRENADEALIKILIHFRGLKTLNLSSNEMYKGLSSVFVVLKRLYRQKKSKLEILILNKCALDETSFYELGELLKSKYCKLKKIYFNNNPLPNNFNFLKKLKQNNSLTEIYFNKSDITDSSIEDILPIIGQTKIRTFYLFKNKLCNFNNFLRIIFRTKIIKDRNNHNQKIINEDVALINLDLSNNEYPLKNSLQIKLLKQIIQETGLYCLDICHILYGVNPEKMKGEDFFFNKCVEELKAYLEEQKIENIEIAKNILDNEEDIEKFKDIENDDFIEKDKIEKYLKEIYGKKDSKQTVFLRKIADTIIKEANIKKDEENFDKLVNYLMLKVSKYNLHKLRNQKNKKKLIII